MNKQTAAILKKYGSAIITCGLITFWYISANYALAPNQMERYRVISDGFAIPGMLAVCLGLMIKAASTGILDGLVYGIRNLVLSLLPGGRLRIKKYGDYVEERRARRITGTGFITHVGLLFCLISLIFVILYNKA
ncbi:MAG: DUF3899 domain-containing protein [Erysipelotrichaceae bacterium]|nr:DUF3899 domain-containing protein [Erysipelotrichaceae bacterium]